MKRLKRVDFVGGSTPVPVAGWSLAAVSAVLLGYVGAQVWALQAEGQTLARQVASAELTIAAAKAADVPTVVPAGTLVATHGGLPWSDLLAAFDDHADPRIGLMKFEPDASGRLRLSARARDVQAVAAFVRGLQSDNRLKDVALLAQATDRAVADRPVTFSLLAGWRGAEGATNAPLAR